MICITKCTLVLVVNTFLLCGVVYVKSFFKHLFPVWGCLCKVLVVYTSLLCGVLSLDDISAEAQREDEF